MGFPVLATLTNLFDSHVMREKGSDSESALGNRVAISRSESEKAGNAAQRERRAQNKQVQMSRRKHLH